MIIEKFIDCSTVHYGYCHICGRKITSKGNAKTLYTDGGVITDNEDEMKNIYDCYVEIQVGADCAKNIGFK